VLTPNAFTRIGYSFEVWATILTGSSVFADGAFHTCPADATLNARGGCLSLSVTVLGTQVSADKAEATLPASLSQSPWTSFTRELEGRRRDRDSLPIVGKRDDHRQRPAKAPGNRFKVKATNAAICYYTSAESSRVDQWSKQDTVWSDLTYG
jgi:hypothetical protein